MIAEEKRESNPARSFRILMRLGLLLPLASVVAAMISGLGSRWGLWHFSTGFMILAGAAVAGAISSVVALIALIAAARRNQWERVVLFCAGLALAITAFGIPYSWYRAAKQLPRIHDITTDTEDPPRLVAVIPLRGNAPNPPEYGGPEVAAKQREAYPDIRPLILDIPPERAFDKALSAAQRMRWKIVEADSRQMRIEATDTTSWFGFRDDIVIRITPLGTKSRVDVRSASRVGLSDVGTNAARIRKYFRELAKSA